VGLVANIIHDPIDLVLIKFNTKFRLKASESQDRVRMNVVDFP
jgi:hypothetical protein